MTAYAKFWNSGGRAVLTPGEGRKLTDILVQVIRLRGAEFFADKENELAHVVVALPASGLSYDSHPSLWSSLAEACMQIPVPYSQSKPTGAGLLSVSQFNMLVNGIPIACMSENH